MKCVFSLGAFVNKAVENAGLLSSSPSLFSPAGQKVSCCPPLTSGFLQHLFLFGSELGEEPSAARLRIILPPHSLSACIRRFFDF